MDRRPTEGTDVWGWIAWIGIALAVWIAVAAFVGVLLGRTVRRRDEQVPAGEAHDVVPPTPAPAREQIPVHEPVPEQRPRT